MQDYQPTTNYNPEQFGMTEQDINNNKFKNVLNNIKLFFQKIEPTLIRIFNISVYYFIKFIKSFATEAFKMIKGGQ